MRITPYCFLLFLSTALGSADLQAQDIKLIDSSDTMSIDLIDPQVIFDSIPTPVINTNVVNRSFQPRVFSGYKRIKPTNELFKLIPYVGLEVMTSEITDSVDTVLSFEDIEIVDSLATGPEDLTNLTKDNITKEPVEIIEEKVWGIYEEQPKWLREGLRNHRIQEEVYYSYMITNPLDIEYAYWNLPEPPVLFEDDPSFLAFIRKQKVPDVDPENAVIPENELKKTHWLHKFNTLLQLSQAFISPNWYQGGNNYYAVLFNFNWNVQLNQVYHPNILFQSDLLYKLAISSTPKGSLHKYQISEDIFQYNLNTGLKAYKNWFYSLNLQFKTQLFNNFADDSYTPTANFLSPSDLNIGLGMAYNHQNKAKTFQYTLTISPLSYNLKTCLSDKINHSLYNIDQDKKTKSEIGSNVEFTMDWSITSNIKYKTRAFLFTDYSYFLADWQNTLSFEINKFLSTQIFVNLRWDTSTDSDSSWKKFMLKEILSFGLSYTFSTKP